MRTTTSIGGIEVVDGAPPPRAVVEHAMTCLAEGRLPLWVAPRLFVDTGTGCIVGSGIFKGEPDEGRVEIGYGIAEVCRRRGHATAAVRAMVAIASAEPGVRAVHAETAVVDVASRGVVQKAGFTHAGRRDDADDGPVDRWFIDKPASTRD